MHDDLRKLGVRVEQFFDWYRRQEPELVPETAAEIVASFTYLSSHPSREQARKLLPATETFAFGALWEEMRLALKEMARA
ncbi:MAG: hypothetical protein IAE78_30710 [Myxococcus sp.]|nr:hypothetical protein [Myxococcus sp.]